MHTEHERQARGQRQNFTIGPRELETKDKARGRSAAFGGEEGLALAGAQVERPTDKRPRHRRIVRQAFHGRDATAE